MKSIYKKILLWALGALVISMAMFFGVTRSIEMRLGINDLFARTQILELDQIRAAYETGGRQQAADFIARMKHTMGWSSAWVLGPDQHDLATGVDRSDLIAEVAGRWQRPVDTPHDGTIFALRSQDNQYTLIAGSTVPFEP